MTLAVRGTTVKKKMWRLNPDPIGRALALRRDSIDKINPFPH